MKDKNYAKTLCVILAIACIILLFMNYNLKNTPKLKNGEEVVASIKGKKFTASDIYSELKDDYGTKVLVNLIDEYIANKEITDEEEADDYAEGQIAAIKAQLESYGQKYEDALKQAGYKDESELKKDIIADYKINKVPEKHIKESITDKEIKEYYDKNIEGTMDVRYILIKPDVTDGMTDEQKAEAETKAFNKAKEVIKKLNDGGKFADLAKEYSDDATTAPNGGLYKGFAKDEVVTEFWNAASDLKDKKYTTTPVKSVYGYFVIYRIKQNEKPKLKEVEDEIRETLANKKMTEDTTLTTKAWFDVRKKYKLNIIDTDIKEQYNTTAKSVLEEK